jgi:hypothetical protein
MREKPQSLFSPPMVFVPLEVSVGIQLDDIDINGMYSFVVDKAVCAGDGVAAIGGLNEGFAPLTAFLADGFGPLEVTIGI